ncbi:MAG: sulfatase-like hydrolase/transferase [Bdellovibrionota bacterium]
MVSKLQKNISGPYIAGVILWLIFNGTLLVLSWKTIYNLNTVALRQFIFSLLFSIPFWISWNIIIKWCLTKSKNTQLLAALIILLTAIILWIPIGTYLNYGIFPNHQGVLLVANQIKFAQEALIGMVDTKHGLVFISILIILTASAFHAKKNIAKKKTNPIKWASYFILYILLATFIKSDTLISLSIEARGHQFLGRLLLWYKNPPPFFHLQKRSIYPFTPEKKIQPNSFNVLFIIGETLAANHLSFWGAKVDPTPNLTKILSNSDTVPFKKLHSNASCTDLSLPSILTGLEPIKPLGLFLSSYLPFDIFKAYGFKTFLISSHNYDWANLKAYIINKSIDFHLTAEQVFENASHNTGISDMIVYKNSLDFINKNNSKPFFGMLHLNTTHPPYLIDESDQPYNRSNTPPQISDLEIRYLNSLYHWDKMFSSFWNNFQKLPLADKTLIVFTSDHGEAFGEHGLISHCGRFYEEESLVPGFIYVPKKIQKIIGNQKIKTLKSNQNLFIANTSLVPTIYHLTNTLSEEKLKFFNAPPLSLHNYEKNEFTFSNCSEFRNCPLKHIGIYKDGIKYLYEGNTNQWSAFRIEEDPKEKNNIILKLPAEPLEQIKSN